jgi:hypothetical protein
LDISRKKQTEAMSSRTSFVNLDETTVKEIRTTEEIVNGIVPNLQTGLTMELSTAAMLNFSKAFPILIYAREQAMGSAIGATPVPFNPEQRPMAPTRPPPQPHVYVISSDEEETPKQRPFQRLRRVLSYTDSENSMPEEDDEGVFVIQRFPDGQ